MQDQSTYHHQVISAQFPEQERLKCPRCESTNTKFCYYNNYNLSQPRHYCKGCRRYWTKGGALRNIPIGGGTRKPTKRSSNTKPDPKMGKSLSNGGRNLDRGSAGSGHDPNRSSTEEPSSGVRPKGQNRNNLGELESKGLRMKASDHSATGEDVDPDKDDTNRVSDHGFASIFGSREDTDNGNGVKGPRPDGMGLGVGMGMGMVMAQPGGVAMSRDSNIGSDRNSGYGELGIIYSALQNGDSCGGWLNGNRWTDLANYSTHDKNSRFQ